MPLTQRRAAFRVRQLLDELHLLMVSFPDLNDAFDADELPLAFILRRDSRLMKANPKLLKTTRRADEPATRRTTPSRTQSRRGRRKQMPDE